MKIRDLFVSDVTRDIPPVVYFHEQDGERLSLEVREYIVTGGYDEGSPQARRVPNGIHEEFRKLVGGLHRELARPGGPSLPAAWISGFYGSGKSSFAKLVGLGLDKRALPDGRSLADALGARDDSPNGDKLREEWAALRARVDSMAVVFDIGGVARDNEHIHTAALRKARERLGYSSNSTVADFEHKLEQDGHWERFLEAARTAGKGREWRELLKDSLVDQHFSHALHVLDPVRYPDPMSWIDAHSGQRHAAGTSVEESVRALDEMLQRRAPGKTLFFVIDEVSQYVHQDEGRMLRLQSWVSELGQRMKGRAWVFATGQQKLEEQGATSVLAKLKDRFPPALRVHLDPANIRDVVHKRLLKKNDLGSRTLRELFNEHRADLRLHALGCEELTEEDFVEIYPLLPSHIDLLLRITTALRDRSSRAQSDAHAIRGLLQLLGELFRQQKLADFAIGNLVSFDRVYEVLHSALSPDMQSSLARIMASKFVADAADEDKLAERAVKVIAMLEQIQSDREPTTVKLVAQCLYRRMGEGNGEARVRQVLQALEDANFLSKSEQTGYKIQSSAGQQWQRERDDYDVGREVVVELARSKVVELFGQLDRPRFRGQSFPYIVYFGDARTTADKAVVDGSKGEPGVVLDVRYAQSAAERESDRWFDLSNRDERRDRMIWVTGDPDEFENTAVDLVRSRRMVEQNSALQSRLAPEKQHLLIEEKSRLERLEKEASERLGKAVMAGTLYFRGRVLRPTERAQAFASALLAMANEVLPELYSNFVSVAITEAELHQLFEPTLMGPSAKFFDTPGMLGILSQDMGRTVVSCQGEVPKRLLKFIEDEKSVSGSRLLAHFGRPPYGHPKDLQRAVVLGLLRAGHIKIRPEEGAVISSVRDAGARDVFKDRAFNRAEIVRNDAQTLTARDMVALAKFFKDRFGRDNIAREPDAIADAVFELFPARHKALSEFGAKLARLPRKPALPALRALDDALIDCLRSRQIEETVLSLKARLDVLRDGLEQLSLYNAELTEEAITVLCRADAAVRGPLAQLRAAESDEKTALRVREDEDGKLLFQQLESERPWRDAASVAAHVERVWERYREARRALLAAQMQAIDETVAQVQSRPGFERLDDDARHRVLRAIKQAAFETGGDHTAPSLDELEERFPRRLALAEERANNELDESLRKESKNEVIVQRFDARLRGREVSSERELDELLAELRERAMEELRHGRRVRFS
jgi:hypothetical protein